MATTPAGRKAKNERMMREARKADPDKYIRSHFFEKGDARLQVVEYNNAIEIRPYDDAQFFRQTDWGVQILDGVPAKGAEEPTTILEIFARAIAYGWTHYKSTN